MRMEADTAEIKRYNEDITELMRQMLRSMATQNTGPRERIEKPSSDDDEATGIHTPDL